MEKTDNAREILQTKAEALFDREGKVVLEYATGVGKTYAALKLIERDGGYWDILCPTLAIVKGWHEEINKHRLHHLLDKVRIYAYQSLHKYSDTRGVNYCADECHNITELRLELMVANTKPDSKFIGLSATVDFERKGLLVEMGITSKHYLKFNTDKAVKAGIVVDYTLWVYKVPLGTTNVRHPRMKTLMSETAAIGFLNRKIKELQRQQNWDKVNFFAIWRKQVLNALPSKERAARFFISRLPEDKKTLIFAANIEQSDRLCENSYHSKGDQTVLERFKNDEIMTMSSVAKVREGVNAPCDIIIRLGVDSKEKNLIQSLGRALRLDPNDPDKKAIAVVLIAEGTQEEKWLTDSIGSFKNVRYGTLNN